MNSTGFLDVRGTVNAKDNEVSIHPNDGFDLGLMVTPAGGSRLTG